jgi:hypothetical protein
MVKFAIAKSYVLKIQNRMDVDLPYDITDIDPATLPGTVSPLSTIELVLNVTETPVVDPCVKLLTLPYSYGRPVFVEFNKKPNDPITQYIELTEMPGFTMIENDDTEDHILEFGHHVKLYGDTTDNICLDIWCDPSAPNHHH